MEMETRNRALDKIYKRRDRYEIPDWQREEVWSKSKKQKLIDSILNKWKLPKFYFVKVSDSPEEYEVVDGQQRLTAIFEFLDNELPLSDSSAKKFGAKYYEDLDDDISDEFDDFEIQFDEIIEADDKDLKEFFLRLQEGLPLTSSEKLNAVESKLRDFCVRASKHGFFKNTCYLANKRYSHFDVIAKAATIEVEGLSVGLRLDDMRQVFESQKAFSPNSQVAKRIKAALTLLESSFPKDSPIFRNRAVTQSFVTLACRIIENSPSIKKLRKLPDFAAHFQRQLSEQVELGHAATDPDYLAFQKTVNANVKSGPRIRHRVLIRKFLQFDPSVAELFDPVTIAEGNLDQEIQRQGEAVASLVTEINEVYSSANGKDLIKLTNKTTAALKIIRTPIKKAEDWKTLVENFYYLLREGPGSKLDGNWPQSFVDINDLRTAQEHDVDHGKTGKAAAKKKMLGDTFKKYSGVTSPSVVDPVLFPAIKSKLLAEIDKDLRALKKKYA